MGKSLVWRKINFMKIVFIMNMFKIKLKCKLRRYRPTLNQRVGLFIRDELNFKIGSCIIIVKERANIDVLRFLQKTF